MSYKTPLIVKEIYLPFEVNGEYTLDEYKNKFGIDLRDYFDFYEDANKIVLKPTSAKIFVVTISVDSVIDRTIPLQMGSIPPNGDTIILMVLNSFYDIDIETIKFSSMLYVTWDYTEQKIKVMEY